MSEVITVGDVAMFLGFLGVIFVISLTLYFVLKAWGDAWTR